MQRKCAKSALGIGWVFIGLLVMTAGTACSSGDDDDDDGSAGTGGTAGTGGGGGSGNGTGADLCGTAKCPAGQYCVDGVACTPGCTTSEDCGTNQVCGSIDDVTHVGTCEDVATKDCPGYLIKCEACGGGELCTQKVCDALSMECVKCIADSNCDDSADCPCD